MTDKLKKIIENATIKSSGTFRTLILIPKGEYKTGCDNIMILGQEDYKSGEWFLISTTRMAFHCFSDRMIDVLIPSDLGVPVMIFNEPMEIDNDTNPNRENVVACGQITHPIPKT